MIRMCKLRTVYKNLLSTCRNTGSNPVCAFCNPLGYPSGFCGEGSYFLSESKQYLPTGGMGSHKQHTVGIKATPHRDWDVMRKRHTEGGHTGIPKHRTLKNSLDFWLLLKT